MILNWTNCLGLPPLSSEYYPVDSYPIVCRSGDSPWWPSLHSASHPVHCRLTNSRLQTTSSVPVLCSPDLRTNSLSSSTALHSQIIIAFIAFQLAYSAEQSYPSLHAHTMCCPFSGNKNCFKVFRVISLSAIQELAIRNERSNQFFESSHFDRYSCKRRSADNFCFQFFSTFIHCFADSIESRLPNHTVVSNRSRLASTTESVGGLDASRIVAFGYVQSMFNPWSFDVLSMSIE